MSGVVSVLTLAIVEVLAYDLLADPLAGECWCDRTGRARVTVVVVVFVIVVGRQWRSVLDGEVVQHHAGSDYFCRPHWRVPHLRPETVETPLQETVETPLQDADAPLDGGPVSYRLSAAVRGFRIGVSSQSRSGYPLSPRMKPSSLG